MLPHLIERARRRELGDLEALVLQQLARGAFCEAAGDDQIWLQCQHILRLAGEQAEVRRLVLVPRTEGIARKWAETENLFGIGEGDEQLIRAQIDRGDARLPGRLQRIGDKQRDDGSHRGAKSLALGPI